MVPLLYLIPLTCCIQHFNAYIPPFKSKILFVSKDTIAFTLGFTIQGSNTTKHIQYWCSNEAYAIALLIFLGLLRIHTCRCYLRECRSVKKQGFEAWIWDHWCCSELSTDQSGIECICCYTVEFSATNKL